jgi:hypothetical protein
VLTVAAAVIAAVALVAAAFEWTSHRSSAPHVSEPPRPSAFQPPVAVAADTSYIRTTVLRSGVLRVEHWIHTRAFVYAVTLQVPQVPEVPSGEITYSHVVLASAGHQLPATGAHAGTAGHRFPLPPTKMLYVRYDLSGAVRRTGSTAGRALARLTSLDVHLDTPLSGSTRVIRGADILALACYPRGSQAVPVPCGSRHGETWRLHLGPRSEATRVMAQLDLG